MKWIKISCLFVSTLMLNENNLLSNDNQPKADSFLSRNKATQRNELIKSDKQNSHLEVDSQIVCVNQIAYNKGEPKRFTVPTANQDLPFFLIEAATNKRVYKGLVKDKTGDFSAFNPESSHKEYFIEVWTQNKPLGRSYPFQIGPRKIQDMTYQSGVWFFTDSRSMVGTHPSAWGGMPWRDGTYYNYEVPSMVLLYLSDPDAFNRMPVSIDWDKDKSYLFRKDFKPTKEPSDERALATSKAYFTLIGKPLSKDIPDIIQLIRWGICWNLLNPVSLDPSGDPAGEKMHAQTVEQFAYFLYGYPAYSRFIEKSLYKRVLDSTLHWWKQVGLFDVIHTIGTPKGRECPGHSIMPNLLMYEVAKREGIPHPQKFMKAAYNETKWLIDTLNWDDPRFSKGQRMSEQKMITGLVQFYLNYPSLAPGGLKQKLRDWAQRTIALSNNLWDFRKYNDSVWTVPEYNEVGNLAGFPACALAVAMTLESGSLKKRLVQIAFAHIDNLFGRNPQNAFCANFPQLGFQGVEKGWPYIDTRKDVCARLETVRGSFSSCCGSEMYPYNPAGKPRWAEGWTCYNSAFNVSMAFLNFYENHDSFNMLRFLK